jgi:hypothetical protein
MEIPKSGTLEPLKGAQCFLHVPKEPSFYVDLKASSAEGLKIGESMGRDFIIQGKSNQPSISQHLFINNPLLMQSLR